MAKTPSEIEETEKRFKQFDIITGGFSDHHFASSIKLQEKHNPNVSKKIMQEWKILEKNLPETIFVRVYEERIDLLRAAIVGASGTPYHDGIFFFDLHFTSEYPEKPPEVHYHSHGLRLNPNLYANGFVCLSLLNTWTGKRDERWVPNKSTILQVLVSIQGLVLNEEPYFNEPLFQGLLLSSYKEKKSLAYNEEAFLRSCKTMLYVISRPPTHFRDFVREHFRERALTILLACRAYVNGVKIGSSGSGSGCSSSSVMGNQKTVSLGFKKSMVQIYPKLVQAFLKNGSSLGTLVEQIKLEEENDGSKKVPKAVKKKSSWGSPKKVFKNLKKILGLKQKKVGNSAESSNEKMGVPFFASVQGLN